MRVKAWTSIEFLESLLIKTTPDLLDRESRKRSQSALELIDLIESSEINIDADAVTINSLVQNGNPFYKYLIKNRLLNPAKQEFNQFKSDPGKYFKNCPKGINIYLLNSMGKEYQSRSGYYFLKSEDNLSVLFEETREKFSKDEAKDWSFALDVFEPHHSIIVADPYIFKDNSFNSLTNLLRTIAPKNLESPYHLTIIGGDQQKAKDLPSPINVKKKVDQLYKDLFRQVRNLELEYFICNKEEFHDRYAITNNTYIHSGHGFGIIKCQKGTMVANKETEWIISKPYKRLSANGVSGVLILKLMINSIDRLKKLVSGSNQNFKNPLFGMGGVV